MFTLSGAHVFPLYDGAVKADPPMRMLDVRHEQTAVFAAEATAKLTRRPGLAVLTAGPGVTNGVSAVTSAWFNGSPVVVLGGRAPDVPLGQRRAAGARPPAAARPGHQAGRRPSARRPRWPSGSTRRSGWRRRRTAARSSSTSRWTSSSAGPRPTRRPRRSAARLEPDPDDLAEVAALLGEARRPVLVLGSDVWADGAEAAAPAAGRELPAAR